MQEMHKEHRRWQRLARVGDKAVVPLLPLRRLASQQCATHSPTHHSYPLIPLPQPVQRSLVITAGAIGPGKKWESYELTANGKPLRRPMHVKAGDTVKARVTLGWAVSLQLRRSR